MAVKFTNNAATTLAAGINSSATSISVTDGSVFPSLSSGEHFYVTFDDTTNTEIVKVTARSSNTLTVVRGQDNTTARAFSSGDKAELRVVAALLEDVKTEVTSTLSVDTFTGDDSTTAFTLSQAPSSEDNLIVFIEGVYQNPGDFTLSGTTLTLDSAPLAGRKIVAYHVSGAVSGNNLNHDQFTANGSTAAFTLSIAPIHENNTQVFIDGVYQQKDSYAVSGTTLTLDANPANGAKVEVMTFTQTDVNTIPASFVAGLTEVSAVGADHLLVYDATDNALKKALASDLIETVGATPTFTTANITNTTTGDSLLFTTTEDSSTAAPVITLKRNSSSPADADYLGQLKFKGENDADQEVVYAKVTAKIDDASDGTEDGLLEFANIKAGSNNIGMRLTSTDLKLINGTSLTLQTATPSIQLTDTDNNADAYIQGTDGNLKFFADDNAEASNSEITFAVDGTERAAVTSTGLKVNEDGSGTKVIHIRSDFAGVDPAINVSTNHALLFQTNNTERARITNTGRFGLGTTTPSVGFMEVAQTYDGRVGYFNQVGTGGSNHGVMIDCASTSGWAFQTRVSGTTQFGVTGSNTYVGTNLGVGTTSPRTETDIRGEITGGFGAATTGGTQNWNDSTNARGGQGHTLLLGTHTNGNGVNAYFHAFSFEYNSKDGTGNMTQFAIGYINNLVYMRYRYSGSWSSWTQL